MSDYIYKILLAAFLLIAAFLGMQAKRLYKQYVTTETKEKVCRSVVRFVEQIYVDLHGPEKLRQAMSRASEILKQEYGITISDTELVTLIEAAVNEFNNAFRKNSGQGKHEAPAAAAAAEPVRIPDPETGGTATQDEIIAELFAK